MMTRRDDMTSVMAIVCDIDAKVHDDFLRVHA
jgi:hypothetical protein